jgi:hypothetical protein
MKNKELNQEFSWGYLRGTTENPFVLLKDCLLLTMAIEASDIRELIEAIKPTQEPEGLTPTPTSTPTSEIICVDACVECGDYSPAFKCAPEELETKVEGICFYCGGPMVRHKLC